MTFTSCEGDSRHRMAVPLADSLPRTVYIVVAKYDGSVLSHGNPAGLARGYQLQAGCRELVILYMQYLAYLIKLVAQ